MSEENIFVRNPVAAEAIQWTEFGFSPTPVPDWIGQMQADGILTMYKPKGILRFHTDYGTKDVDYGDWVVKVGENKYKIYTSEEFDKEFTKV